MQHNAYLVLTHIAKSRQKYYESKIWNIGYVIVFSRHNNVTVPTKPQQYSCGTKTIEAAQQSPNKCEWGKFLQLSNLR